jgi:hypothetical protein
MCFKIIHLTGERGLVRHFQLSIVRCKGLFRQKQVVLSDLSVTTKSMTRVNDSKEIAMVVDLAGMLKS